MYAKITGLKPAKHDDNLIVYKHSEGQLIAVHDKPQPGMVRVAPWHDEPVLPEGGSAWWHAVCVPTPAYTIRATGPNGADDCRPYTIRAISLQAAKTHATREAPGDRCHIYIDDENGRTLAVRDAADTYRGCCNGGWMPWVTY